MEGYGGALEITVIALGALFIISLFFILITHGLQWMASLSGRRETAALDEPEAPLLEDSSVAVEALAPPAADFRHHRIIDANMVVSPMPGTVLSIFVEVGALVHVGDVLLILESMKIQNEITAHRDGRVAELYVAEGQYVRRKEPLATIEG